jgi:hypothetical protein
MSFQENLKSIQEAYIGMIDEGKFLQTHSKSGKPNPNHPAYAQHKAKYDAEQKEKSIPTPAKQVEENPVKFHHIDDAIGNAYPDSEPYQHLARKFPTLHRATGKNGSKLTDYADATVRKNTNYKTFSDYADDVFQQHKDDAAADAAADAAHNR